MNDEPPNNLRAIGLAPDENVVKALEFLLQEARDGKLRRLDAVASYTTAIRPLSIGLGNIFAVIGQLEMLKVMIVHEAQQGLHEGAPH